MDVGDESLHLVAGARAEKAASVLLLQLVIVGDIERVSVHLRYRDNLVVANEDGSESRTNLTLDGSVGGMLWQLSLVSIFVN